MIEVSEIDRNRLRPAEQQSAATRKLRQDQQPQRYGDGSDRIDVLERVERDAPQVPCGIVAEHPGHIAVRGFVQRDCKDDRNCIEEYRLP